MRSPRSRHPTSPALGFLRSTLLAPPDDVETVRRWRDRLHAGGIVRETAAARDLRRSLPWIGARLEAAGLADAPPADERTLLLAAALRGRARADAVVATLDPLGAACAREGVAPLLLKGLARHGERYPDPAVRPVSDADCLVVPAELPAMRRALDAAGFAPDAPTQGRLRAHDATGRLPFALSDFVFRRRDGAGVPVEAKLDPLQLGVPLPSRRAAPFFDGARPHPRYGGFRVSSPAAAAAGEALHLARHDGSDVVWWAEVAVALAGADGSGEPGAQAIAMVREEGLAGAVRAVWREAAALFPGRLPPAPPPREPEPGWTPARLRARPAAGGSTDERAATWGLQVAHAASAGRARGVAAELWRRIWPDSAYLRSAGEDGRGVLLRRVRRAAGWLAPRAGR